MVIMGLNPSAGIEFGKNFHGIRFDLWYEEAFSKEPFKGCYMTDLISYPEADSNIVIAKWKDEEFRKIHIQSLCQQFELLGVTAQTPILCIGKITKELFKVAFPVYTNVFHINHPNSYRMTGKRQNFIEDVARIGKEMIIN
jgi:hypothetical protein